MCEGLNLGKKISVPRDVMMEELNLTSNRGSRMFQERQRRVERFTLESTAGSPLLIYVRTPNVNIHHTSLKIHGHNLTSASKNPQAIQMVLSNHIEI